MRRGDLYLVRKGSQDDPKNQRVFLVVSRQECINQSFSSVVCAPVYSNYYGFPTQVKVGTDDGLKHDSAVFCDDLISIRKSKLTNCIGHLPDFKMQEINIALRIALATG
jgi:mRNA interferase MazF